MCPVVREEASHSDAPPCVSSLLPCANIRLCNSQQTLLVEWPRETHFVEKFKTRTAGLMNCANNRAVSCSEVRQLVAHGFGHEGVESACWLVSEDDRWLVQKFSGYSKAFLLSTRYGTAWEDTMQVGTKRLLHRRRCSPRQAFFHDGPRHTRAARMLTHEYLRRQ